MSRKPKKGYFVRGKFVAEGSELDVQLKAELKGTSESSKSDLKKEMDALQKLGQDLLGLRADLLTRLDLPEILQNALTEARRISNFEGKRRQMQYIGKLMRKLESSEIDAIKNALQEQRDGSSLGKALLHAAEQWRERMIDSDDAVALWINESPGTDTQNLRALVRQARKDAPSAHEANVQESTGAAARKGRAYRELFHLVREQLLATHAAHQARAGSAAVDGNPAENASNYRDNYNGINQ